MTYWQKTRARNFDPDRKQNNCCVYAVRFSLNLPELKFLLLLCRSLTKGVLFVYDRYSGRHKVCDSLVLWKQEEGILGSVASMIACMGSIPDWLTQPPAEDECQLNVSNDGPVTLDVPVTIYARMTCSGQNYVFEFESDTGNVDEVTGNETATASFIFTKKPGIHAVRVHAHLIHPTQHRVASADTLFNVTEYISGTINVLGSVKDRSGQEYIGTGWTASLSLEVFFPPQVLLDSEFAYSWSIGEERFTNDRSSVQYRFEEPGLKWIRVDIVGRMPSYQVPNHVHYKWGHFDKEITVKNPFFNVNISGNTYLEHGQLLDLEVSCNGSGPVDYCWKLLPSSENQTNLSCSDPATSPECTIPILYYFRNSGDFQLAIYVSNLVSSMQRNVQVHIYDVSLRPQLSTVIIPVVCSVLVMVIIAVAVIIQMRRRGVGNVETADFDFMRMDEANAVAVETSWEIMWRSLVQLLQLRCLLCHSHVDHRDTPHYGTILKER